MRPRVTRIPRRVWLASAALHASLAGGLYLLLPTAPSRSTAPVSSAAPADTFSLSLALPGDEPPADAVPVPQWNPQPEPVAEPGRLPLLTAVPPAVPNDLQAILRDLAARPTPVATPAEDFPLPTVPPDVMPATDIQPVEHVTAAKTDATPPIKGAAKFRGGKPLHGPLPDGAVAVYLLDRSASMGLNRDTFDAARAALIATASATASGSKFQVLTYHGTATPVLRGTAGKLLVSKDDVLADVADAVAELKAEGGSAHEVGLRAAIALGADYVIWITDASDDELATAKRVLKAATKPVAVYVARAANGTVAEPVELR